MSQENTVQWSELRRYSDGSFETYLVLADRSSGGLQLWERSIWEIAWYEISETPALRARAIGEFTRHNGAGHYVKAGCRNAGEHRRDCAGAARRNVARGWELRFRGERRQSASDAREGKALGYRRSERRAHRARDRLPAPARALGREPVQEDSGEQADSAEDPARETEAGISCRPRARRTIVRARRPQADFEEYPVRSC